MPSPLVSRRSFLKSASAVTLASLAPWSAGADAARPRRELPKRFIIDAHQHFSPTPGYVDRLLASYRPRNAMACVNGWRREYGAISAAAQRHPETIIPYGRLSVDDANALADVDYFAANSARGIKLHSPKRDWDDERYFPIYERITKHGLMALFHTGINAGGYPRMRPSLLLTDLGQVSRTLHPRRSPGQPVVCGSRGSGARATAGLLGCHRLNADQEGDQP
jgi:hypothetical protein